MPHAPSDGVVGRYWPAITYGEAGMTTYYVERTVGYSHEKLEMDAADVLAMAKRGLAEMEAKYTHNETAYRNLASGRPGQFSFTYYALGECIKRRYNMQFSNQTVDDFGKLPEQAEGFTADLRMAIEAQKKFIEELTFAKPDLAGHFFSGFNSNAIVARVFSGVLCPDCGYIINKSSFKQHRVSMKCMTDSSNRDVREAGYVELTTGPEMTAARVADIKIELRPSGYTMWAPPWVGDAVETYRRNNGFAGLSLGQYLAKMKPNEDKQG